ncbi:MAG: hypothetical protein M1814_002658 [Vezdaea aestivalis]|nr:MAG: hypothetical protein M1814_002658 [Vezdaea aestivalis]
MTLMLLRTLLLKLKPSVGSNPAGRAHVGGQDDALAILSFLFKIDMHSLRGIDLNDRGLGRVHLVWQEFLNKTLEMKARILIPAMKTSNPSANEVQEKNLDISGFLSNLPEFAQKTVSAANPVALVNRMMPADVVPREARHVAAYMTEGQDPTEGLAKCAQEITWAYHNKPSKADDAGPLLKVVAAFRDEVDAEFYIISGQRKRLCATWKKSFWREVLGVVEALQAEENLGYRFTLKQWLDLRVVTISARPMMVLVRMSLGLRTDLGQSTLCDPCPPEICQIEGITQAVLGLQNDIIGWDKDVQKSNQLNAIEVLVRNGLSRQEAFREMMDLHNKLVSMGSTVALSSGKKSRQKWTLYLRTLSTFQRGMANYMLMAKRYLVEDDC